MRKRLFVCMMLIASLIGFVSCSDDKFDYPEENLLGTWSITHVKSNGKWSDVTGPAFADLAASITFFKDGSYYGTGYFGDGGGTYVAKGKTITTYVDGEVYGVYEVKSMDSTTAEITMSFGDESMDIKAKKRI